MGIRYRIILDTDHYAGNFERESVAYATGQVGECEVGEKEARRAKREVPAEDFAFWEAHLIPIADEHGVKRPAQVWGDGYAIAIDLDQPPSSGLVERYAARIRDFLAVPDRQRVLRAEPVAVTAVRVEREERITVTVPYQPE